MGFARANVPLSAQTNSKPIARPGVRTDDECTAIGGLSEERHAGGAANADYMRNRATRCGFVRDKDTSAGIIEDAGGQRRRARVPVHDQIEAGCATPAGTPGGQIPGFICMAASGCAMAALAGLSALSRSSLGVKRASEAILGRFICTSGGACPWPAWASKRS
jgi:hypothetical protein